MPEALHLWLTDLIDAKWEYRPRQTELQAPNLKPAVHRPGAYIFCGRALDNFGHFIMESLARIWFAKAHPTWTLVWIGADDYLPWQREILDLLGIRNPACFITEPTALERLAIPSPGHLFPHFYAPYYLAAVGVVEPKPIVPGRRVFLSRSRGKAGGFVNEGALDRLLTEAGWSILHPETLRVADRFDLLSSAEIILMVEGAAFASLLLLRDLKSKVFALARDHSERFSHALWFGDLFHAIAVAKELDYRRLDLPRLYLGGIDHSARFELDLPAFECLLRETYHLCEANASLAAYDSTTDVDPTQARGLAQAAIAGVSTQTPQAARHAYLSALAEAKGDLIEANRQVGLALAARPDSICLLTRRVRLAKGLDDPVSAATALERAITLDASAPAGWHAELAGILLQTGEAHHAVARARRAVELEESSAHHWGVLGTALARCQASIEARQALERAVALDAGFIDALNSLSHVCAHVGDSRAALAWVEEAVQKAPARADLQRHLGDLRRMRGDWSSAEEAYQRAIELNPDDSVAQAALAALWQRSTGPLSGLRCSVSRVVHAFRGTLARLRAIANLNVRRLRGNAQRLGG